jgi:hypothetical protein
VAPVDSGVLTGGNVQSLRILHKGMTGLVMILPFIGWAITGAVFFIKPATALRRPARGQDLPDRRQPVDRRSARLARAQIPEDHGLVRRAIRRLDLILQGRSYLSRAEDRGSNQKIGVPDGLRRQSQRRQYRESSEKSFIHIPTGVGNAPNEPRHGDRILLTSGG